MPSTPDDAHKDIGSYWEKRERCLNGLGAEGWVLVTEEQGVYYLKRRKQ